MELSHLEFAHIAHGGPIERLGLFIIAGGVALVSSISGQLERIVTTFRGQTIEVAQQSTRLSLRPFADNRAASRVIFNLPELLPNATEWDLRVMPEGQLETLFLQFGGVKHQIMSATSTAPQPVPVKMDYTDCFGSLSFVRALPEHAAPMFSVVSCFRNSSVYLFRKEKQGAYHETRVLDGALSAKILYFREGFLVFYKKRENGALNALLESPGQLHLAILGSDLRLREEKEPPLGNQIIYEFAVDMLPDGKVAVFATTPGPTLLAAGDLRTGRFSLLADAKPSLVRPAMLVQGHEIYVAAIESPKDNLQLLTAVHHLSGGPTSTGSTKSPQR